MNNELTKPFGEKEIKAASFTMPLHKSPRPDGIPQFSSENSRT